MKTLPILAAALVLPAIAIGQERTAGQAYDAQVNWSTLKSSIDLVSSQNKILAATLDKVTGCNKKKMIYAPGDSAADADGCADTGLALGQELPAPPACIDMRFKRQVPLGGGFLVMGPGNRLLVTYSGSSWFPGACGSSVTTTYTRTYDGKSFSACSTNDTTNGSTVCGKGRD